MILGVTAAAFPEPCLATGLPYSTRDKAYSGWTAATQSDINTTGMSGATVALPASISSAQSNPAGFAMETGSISAQINRISIEDRSIQPDGQSIDSSQWGLGVSPPPWGFALSYYSPITESAIYAFPVTPNALQTEVSLKEFRLTVARTWLDSRLAVGFSAELVKAVRELGSYSFDSVAPSFSVGALYRVQDHVVFGASYTPPITIAPASGGPTQSVLPGFNQAVLRPSELDFGVGWVPNRFFKLGVSLSYIGDTTDTGLLADQSIATGVTPSWIPRVGASYVLAQFANFESELAVGSYFAASRLSGDSSRVHVTTGWEVNPFFVNLGLGFDLSSDYSNIMFGVGIDVVRTLRALKIVPPDPTPPLNGFLPNAGLLSAEGLPDAMTLGEEKTSSPPDLKDVGKILREAPSIIGNRLKGPATKKSKKKGKKIRDSEHALHDPS